MMDRASRGGSRAAGRAAALALAALLWACRPAWANNPCIHDAYTADPTPLWVNNTMYIYCSHDANFTSGQTGYNIPNDVLIHSTDLVNWEDDGVIVTSGVGNPWAPAVVYLNGTYYLYYTAGGGAVGVLTSSSPYGPFAGGNTSLVNGGTSDPGMGGNLLDPAVFIDSSGQAYLYFGGGGPGSGAGNCSRVIKLNANMISVSGSGSGVPAPNFFEASGINVRNGVYYYSYSSDPAFGMNIEYIMANNPLFTGPTIPAQPIAVANGGAGNCYNNQGGGFVNIGSTWYAAYFNRALANANGLACSQGAYQRSVCFDQMNFNADGTIQEVTQTTNGPTALHNVDPYSTQDAACMADQGGVAPAGLSEKGPQSEACSEGGRDLTAIAPTDWIRVRNLAFGGCTAAFTARVAASAAGGSIQVRLDSATGTLVGTCAIPSTGGMQTWQNVSCPVSGATGLHDLYFVFSGTTFNFRSYSFSTCGTPSPSPSGTPTSSPSPTPGPSPTATRTPSPIPTPNACSYLAGVACGATAPYTSSQLGRTFGADQAYVPGSAPGAAGSYGYVSWAAGTAYASTATITGGDAADAALYNNQRYGATLGYAFSVPNGPAYVTFYWAETYATAAGQRVFGVSINGTTVEAALDLYATAGSDNTYSVTFPVTVSNGLISIQGTASVNNAEFQGISVQAGPACSPTPTASRTWTVSPSPSATGTASPSATRTASPSATRSASPSLTPSASPTATGTVTGTGTVTPSLTASPAATATPTATVTLSWTASPAATATPTAAVTPSWTASPAATATPTATVTPSWTASPAGTETVTPSWTATVTLSWTASPAATATLTETEMPSWTASPAATATRTETVTPSWTASPVATATRTETVTPSWTASPAATATATPLAQAGIVAPSPLEGPATGGFAVSVSVTGFSSTALAVDFIGTTLTATLPAALATGGGGATLLTATLPLLTAAQAAGATGVAVYLVPLGGGADLPVGLIALKAATATPSPAAGSGPLVIRGLDGVPNPNPDFLAVDLEGDGDALTATLYSPALVKVGRLAVAAPLSRGWNRVALGPLLKGLGPGLYFLEVQAHARDAVSVPRIARIFLTRR